ncbi:hypothetical protein MKX07_006656 [Trichoderma sp. CBMAI-0711]|nr:hypothetical protein MKX07_006656 [Trichoderma sp. CBMAI-0711]
MAWSRAITYAVLSSLLFRPANAERVWPDPKVDELEKLLYEQENPFDGPGGLASFVDGCSGPAERALGIGRSFGAEWIRNAYHDMSTADVFAGTGGLDASIVFEMDRPENIGDAFQETLNIFKGNYNKRVAKEFVANVSQNPLAFGQNETTRSDFRIFNADGGNMISQMATSNDFFLDTCNTMFERMINTVPSNVKLTDINPLDVKPRKLTVTVNDDETLSVTGVIRVVDNLINGNGTRIMLNLTAAVLNAERFSNVSLIVPQPSNKSAPISPWTQEEVTMQPLSKVDGTNYTLYTGIWQSSGPTSAASTHPFDIVAVGPHETVSSLFNSWDDIPRN